MDVLLVYFKNDGERKDFPLEKDKIVFGRKEDCDYRIPVDQVSRQHCEFTMSEEGVFVRDLDSSNGTYVNNKRVAEAQLKPGDHVVIGPAVFTVVIDNNPADPKPVKVRLEDQAGQPGAGDITDDILEMGDEEDDETRKTSLLEQEDDEDAADDVLYVSNDNEQEDVAEDDDAELVADEDLEEDDSDEDSLSQALEALATGGDEEDDDPFADIEPDEKK